MVDLRVLIGIVSDAVIVSVYWLHPLGNESLNIVRDDIYKYTSSGSLFDLVILAMLRLILMVALLKFKSRSRQNTRWRITLMILWNLFNFAFALVKITIWIVTPDAMHRWKRVSFGQITFWMILSFSLVSCLLETWYVLSLNSMRVADSAIIEDPEVMEHLLGFRPSEKTYAARWRQKWEEMAKNFVPDRFKEKRPGVFAALVQAFCHNEDAVSMLKAAVKDRWEEFKFFVPQLCTFILLGASKDASQLTELMLQRCENSYTFAHHMWWFLKSFCADPDVFLTPEQFGRLQNLIKEVEMRGSKPVQQLLDGFYDVSEALESIQGEGGSRIRRTESLGKALYQAVSDNFGSSSSNSKRNTECSPENDGGKDGREEHETTNLLSASSRSVGYGSLSHSVSISSLGPPYLNGKVTPFTLNTTFTDELTKLADTLRSIAPANRNAKLKFYLERAMQRFLPSEGLYVPVGNPYHRIRSIVTSESFCFSSKMRVPYLVCFEVVDFAVVDDDNVYATTTTHSGANYLHGGHGAKSSPEVVRKKKFVINLGGRELQWRLPVGNGNYSSDEEEDIMVSTPQVDRQEAALGFWTAPRTSRSTSPIASPFAFLEEARNSRGKEDGSDNDFTDGRNVIESEDRCSPDDGELYLTTDGEDYPKVSLVPSTTRKRKMKRKDSKNRRLKVEEKVSTKTPSLISITSPKAQTTLSAIQVIGSNRKEDQEQQNLYASKQQNTLISQAPATRPVDRPTHRSKRLDSVELYLRQHSDSFEYDEDPGEENDIASPDASKGSNLPPVLFKERWKDKEERLKLSSPWGQRPGWRLVPVIIKSNDDLRQEQFASQLIKQFYKVYVEAKLPVWVRPYEVLATGTDCGLVEAIPDTASIDSLKRNDLNFTSLYDFYIRHYGRKSSRTFKKARSNFVKSMAGYAIICYLLNIKDRHNGNILLDAEGHVIHIDFGFMLANSPGNVEFERAPFKLTSEFVQVMGGPRSSSFRRFRSLCVRSFLVARKSAHRFILLMEMVANGNEKLPCFGGDPAAALAQVRDRFKLDLSARETEDYVHSLIDMSLDNWRTRWYDKYQRWCVGIF